MAKPQTLLPAALAELSAVLIDIATHPGRSSAERNATASVPEDALVTSTKVQQDRGRPRAQGHSDGLAFHQHRLAGPAGQAVRARLALDEARS
jgi:hypothetical protein